MRIGTGVNATSVPELTKFLTYYYFMMTTLAKIGYGDLYPVSTQEQVFGIFIMITGMIFFSFVLD